MSCYVTWGHRCFFANNFLQERDAASRKVSFYSARQDASNDWILTYFDQIWPWGQILTTFRGQTIHILTRLDETKKMAFELWPYLYPFKSYRRKPLWSIWVIDATSEVTVWPWALNIGTVGVLLTSPTSRLPSPTPNVFISSRYLNEKGSFCLPPNWRAGVGDGSELARIKHTFLYIGISSSTESRCFIMFLRMCLQGRSILMHIIKAGMTTLS